MKNFFQRSNTFCEKWGISIQKVNKMKDPVSFSDKLFLLLTDKLGESQKEDITRQIEGDTDLKRLVKELRDTPSVRRIINEMDSFDVEHAWKAVKEKAAMQEPIRKPASINVVLRKYLIPVAVAAVLTGLAFLIPLTRNTQPEIHLDKEIVTAMIECDDHGMSGAVIETDYVAPVTVKTTVKKQSEDTCEPPKEETIVKEMLAATRITTLYNKEFWLTLPDGTVVHLARNTRLIYPERFTSKQRDVYIEGEAYFIVAKDPDKRFVVHSKAATTVAYGTEFNVDARDDNDCRITLVNGSVGVSTTDGTECRLTPGEQATVIDGSMTISEADLEPIKAWNTGHTEFENWALSRIIEILAKWYGMKTDISDPEIADIKLSGNLDRYDELLPTLESLSELVGVRFHITNNTITASRE